MAHAGMFERESQQRRELFHFAALLFTLKRVSRIASLLGLLGTPTDLGTQHAFQWIRIDSAKKTLETHVP